MLLQGKLNEDKKEKVYSYIYDDSFWLLNLVENLLSVTRIEDGGMKIKKQADMLEDLIEEGFSRAGVSDKISLHIGDAMEFLAAQQGKKEYDLTFIDANKREYPDYYEHVLALTRTGGFILADDVLWDGKVYAEHVPSDKQTAGIVRFNDLAAQDPRVETVILPVRHGLNIIRKK